jgi:hypothetical protein
MKSHQAVRALSAVALCAVGSTVFGATNVSYTSQPTPGLGGFTTYTLTATSEPGTKLIGFNFAEPYGFFGAMNQVNPAGALTVFADDFNSMFLLNPDVIQQDSHFFRNVSDGLRVNPTEGPTELQAAVNYLNPGVATATDIWYFAQLVIPNAASGVVNYQGTFTVQTNGVNSLVSVQGSVPTPEPSSVVLAGLATLGLVIFTRRRG